MNQAHWWILTIPQHEFTPYRPPTVDFIRGQLERGSATQYVHWQIVCHFSRKLRLGGVKILFGSSIHAEPTRSSAALDYVWKEDTRVTGTQFQLGEPPIKRNCSLDWDAVRSYAKCGRLDDIPADIFVRSYNQLKRIAADNLSPVGMVREVICYWGATGTGKSRRAWNEASFDAYPKDPRTKFWDGYTGQKHVVLDEFRGGIDVAHILRWFDRYPVIVEVKGSSVVLVAEKIWITSNLDPRAWYPELDEETKLALLRRMQITFFPKINA